eukprot:7303113-Karenia_brevis.AAC.1
MDDLDGQWSSLELPGWTSFITWMDDVHGPDYTDGQPSVLGRTSAANTWALGHVGLVGPVGPGASWLRSDLSDAQNVQ